MVVDSVGRTICIADAQCGDANSVGWKRNEFKENVVRNVQEHLHDQRAMFLNQVSVLMTSGVIANASTPQENQKVEYQLALLRLAVHTMCPNLPSDKVAATAALFYGPAALPGVEDLQFYLANNQSFTQMEKALEAQFDAASKTLADVEQEPFVSPQIILTNLRQLEDIKNDLSSPSVQNRSPN